MIFLNVGAVSGCYIQGSALLGRVLEFLIPLRDYGSRRIFVS